MSSEYILKIFGGKRCQKTVLLFSCGWGGEVIGSRSLQSHSIFQAATDREWEGGEASDGTTAPSLLGVCFRNVHATYESRKQYLLVISLVISLSHSSRFCRAQNVDLIPGDN